MSLRRMALSPPPDPGPVGLSPRPLAELEAAWIMWREAIADRNGISALLEAARRDTPRYREVVGPLPTVSRADYLANPESFEIRRNVAPDEPTLKSSGTTGAPLKVQLDWASWYGVNFEFFGQICDHIGLPRDRFRNGLPAVLFLSNKPQRANFVMPLPSLNDGLYARVQMPADPTALAAVVKRIQAPILYGKPTYLLQARNLLLAAGHVEAPWCPELILVSGERLYPDDARRLRQYFKAPLVNALASTEGGLIAASQPDTQPLEVFCRNAVLEVLAPLPETGGTGELLLSNLLYRRTVFLRYRTGDSAELGGSPERQVITRLWGRDPERLAAGSVELSTDALVDDLATIPELADYQVEAGAHGFSIRWMAERCAHPDQVLRALKNRVAAYAGEWRFTECAKLTPPGGKKRRFVQEA